MILKNCLQASPVSSVEKCSSAFTPCTQDTPVTSSVLVDSSIVGSSVVQDKHYGGTQQRYEESIGNLISVTVI